MYICRLFHRDRPAEPIEVRLLERGQLRVGRDPSADWPLDDPEGTLSRVHFTLTVEDGRLTLTDSSTNGTFIGGGGRAPRDLPVPIAPGESVRFGPLLLSVDGPQETVVAQSVLGDTNVVLPSQWADGAAPPAPHRDESLIEAFCEGAGIDSSGLSGEDPAELMRRVGAIYQQAVLGLAALTAERGRFKGDHQLERTTISAVDNNPFRWAPSRKLALALLCGRQPGFLTGAEAVRASFDDLARHLSGMDAGARAAVQAVLDRLSPESIDEEAGGHGFSLLRGGTPFRDILAQRHAALSAADRTAIERAFADAYGRADEAGGA